jgi:RHS repeat-associated protein
MFKIYKRLIITGVLFLGIIYTKQALAQVPAISYSGPQSYSVGLPVVPLSPTNTGGTPAVNGQTTTFSGAPPEAFDDPYTAYSQPLGATADAQGNVYIAEGGNHRIIKVGPWGYTTILAGSSSGAHGYANGQGTMATFYHPVGLAADASGNIYVADEDNHAIRKITPAGTVTTFAGSGSQGSVDGTGTAASFYYPCGVAIDASGTLYVADTYNNKIRKITPAGVVTTLAGSGVAGSANATGTAATFNQPFSVAVDASGNVYVTDRSNHKIRKITAAGVVTTLAGSGTAAFAEGTGTAASFNAPTSITIDKQGNLYVTDENNQRIRKIVSSTGAVSTLSGTGSAGSANGIGTASTFNLPFGIAADIFGNVYVGDYTNNLIRKVVYAPYTVVPVLPAGLSFDVTTGTVSGTPTTLSAAASYVINAYNASGKSADAALSIAVVASNAPVYSPSMNYIATYVPRISGILTNSDLYAAASDATKVNVTVEYSDGLGRPVQAVQVKGSPTQRDLVQPIAYDQYGREPTKYLPYPVLPTAADDGSYKATAIADQASFYANPTNASTWNAPGVKSNPFPYAETSLEPSPLSRPLEFGAPGDAWQLTGKVGATSPGHTSKIVYATNNSTGLTTGTGYWAKRYGVTFLYTYDGNYLYKNSLADQGSYSLSQLYVTIVKNENWTSTQTNLKLNTSEEYKDKSGRLIVKRDFNYNPSTASTETLSTYYVYDDYGNMAYVLPPAANPDNGSVTQVLLDTYCYQYRYDGRNRLIGRKVPGKGWDLILYNKNDQQVGHQDSVQRMKSPQEWTVTKYDAVGRTVITGIYQSGSIPGIDNRLALQNTIDTQGYLWEAPTATGDAYTSNSWPSSVTSTLKTNFYDKYFSTLPYSYSSGSKMTRGQLVATKTAILNNPATMLWSQCYFDDQNRPIDMFQQHYLNGTASANNYDEISNIYDFVALQSSTRKHYQNGAGNVLTLNATIADSYIYDHVGRQKQHWNKINSGTNTLVVQNDFNEIDQPLDKKLHSTDGSSFLQTVDYRYNPRGWLTSVNNASLSNDAGVTNSDTNDQFGEELSYEGTTTINKLYDGRVTTVKWKSAQAGSMSSAPPQMSYDFRYDNIGKLTEAMTSVGGIKSKNFSEYLSYNVAGNIISLGRYALLSNVLTQIDSLNYSYSGNRHTKIDDLANNAMGFSNGSTAATEYLYNGNGAITQDLNKGMTSITYNMLNLPQTITTAAGTITNTYDANGAKLRRVSTISGITADYVNGVQYYNGALDFIYTGEGRARRSTTNTYVYEYDLKDHLGNARATFIPDPITPSIVKTVQENSFYPFGLTMQGDMNVSYVSGVPNNYTYNGQELQPELNQYDYGSRLYDPAIGKWSVMDPMGGIYKAQSPYSYVGNDPINYVDHDGQFRISAAMAQKYPTLAKLVKYYLPQFANIPSVKAAFRNLTGYSNQEYSEMLREGYGPNIIDASGNDQNEQPTENDLDDPHYINSGSLFDGKHPKYWANIYVAEGDLIKLELQLKRAMKYGDLKNKGLATMVFKIAVIIMHEATHYANTHKHPDDWAARDVDDLGSKWEELGIGRKFSYNSPDRGIGSDSIHDKDVLNFLENDLQGAGGPFGLNNFLNLVMQFIFTPPSPLSYRNPPDYRDLPPMDYNNPDPHYFY